MLNWKNNYKYNKKKKYVTEELYRINGSCDNCNKKSSIGNRLCNKCFYKLMGNDYEL